MITNTFAFSYDMHAHIREISQDRHQTIPWDAKLEISMTRADIEERAL